MSEKTIEELMQENINILDRLYKRKELKSLLEKLVNLFKTHDIMKQVEGVIQDLQDLEPIVEPEP